MQLPLLRDGQFDVILTDPPYGMGADQFGDSGGMNMSAHSYADTYEVFKESLALATLHFGRLTKDQAHLYWFCDIDRFIESRIAFEAAGWWVHRTPLIWHKPNGSRAPWPEHGPQRKYEFILYAVKGKKPTIKLAGDVITCSNEQGMEHGAQKPVELYKELLSRSCQPGDSVLDCFAGTGPILPAAHELRVKATAIERDATSYGIAAGRLKRINAQLELGI